MDYSKRGLEREKQVQVEREGEREKERIDIWLDFAYTLLF